MTLRFDDERARLRLSVADLLEREARRSLGFSNRGGFERMWLGQAIHSRYQSLAMETDPTYRQEVAVSHDFTHKGWTVTLQGRIDGLAERDGGLLIEEIKSVRRSGAVPRATLETYHHQATIYAWILSQQEQRDLIAELVMIEIGTDDCERLRLHLDLDDVERRIRRRLDTLIRLHEADREALAIRRVAGEELRFPYDSMRRGQSEIVDRTHDALNEREHLLIEAPTGLGKTVATLYPVLRYALQNGKKVYVLTAKNLQQEMAGEVLRLLNTDEAFHSLRLRAKATMCANHEVICHEEYCRFARDYFLKLKTSAVLPELLMNHSDLLPDDIFAAAEAAEVCPFELSLELTGEVEAIVCDYNYVFDPYVGLRHFGGEQDLSDTILVIDEAHNLVDRGRGYYSPELGQDLFDPILERHRHRREPLSQRITEVVFELERLVIDTVEENLPPNDLDGATEAWFPEEPLWGLRPTLDQLFVDYLEYQREEGSFGSEDAFVDLYFAFIRFLDAFSVADASFAFIVRREGGRRSLKVLCRDASSFLGRIINRTHSTLALSATLSPPDFYQQLLGFDSERTGAISLPSPFPEENRRIVIDSDIDTTFKQREANYPRIAERLSAFIRATPGNCLVLFPSYVFLDEVAGRMGELDCDLIVQQRGDGASRREAVLDRLRSSLFGNTALLAVAGGVFAEGVDYPGRMLDAVAIVSPCLPGLSYEQQLLRDFYQERFERGFEFAFIVPGMTRVVQAAGRLIRSDTDRGVIALLGRRFLDESYSRHLPRAWLNDGDVEALKGSADQASRDFWSRNPTE